jgi:hypothetical protein
VNMAVVRRKTERKQRTRVEKGGEADFGHG